MNASAMFFALCSLFLLTDAYPLLSMPQFPASMYQGKIKRNDDGFPMTDDEVLQLENLRRIAVQNEHEKKQVDILTTAIPNKQNLEEAPDLEHQLEATKSKHENGAKNVEKVVVGPAFPQPQENNAQHQTLAETSTSSTTNGVVTPSLAKQYHGAARLAFGQNPEVLPTSSTTSTSTSNAIPTTILTTASSQNPIEPELNIEDKEQLIANVEASLPKTDMTSTNSESQSEQDLSELNKPTATSDANADLPPLNAGETTETELMETSKMAARRSAAPPMSTKAAERLLQHQDGRFSAFDMAQYVFWTGDEPGVARAVEELIERGLMSRENALKLLREIRLGIDYLEKSYANRLPLPFDMRQNHVKKSYTMHPRLFVTPSTTTEQATIPTERPQRTFVPLWRNSKQFDSAATWSKLQQLNQNEDANDYEEAGGRAKIAEYLYTEYTLEEILYKLAKVMFTQSLAHGSDEAQRELQKLTDFLEREGNLGVIPIDLQKKVLNTLLTALSDTLSEHPEFLPAARSNLGLYYNKLEN